MLWSGLLSIWEIKAGSLEEESRDAALLQMLAATAPPDEVVRAQSRPMASTPGYALLSEPAQRMLATAHAVTTALRNATGLDWSVAIIGLCKAVEVEAVQRIAEPLRLAARCHDIGADMADPGFWADGALLCRQSERTRTRLARALLANSCQLSEARRHQRTRSGAPRRSQAMAVS